MFMQMAIVTARTTLLRSIVTRSTNSIPIKLVRFATQKKSPLTMTEGMPES